MYSKIGRKKFETAKNGLSQFFSDNFSQKDCYKFGMAKNGHSKFIQTFLVQKHWKNCQNGQFWLFQIYANLFGENCWKKFRMPIFGHPKFIPVFLGKNVRKNMEHPFLAIPNLYQSFWEKLSEKTWKAYFWLFQIFSDNFSVHITLIECNGLENNEICTFLDFYSEI